MPPASALIEEPVSPTPFKEPSGPQIPRSSNSRSTTVSLLLFFVCVGSVVHGSPWFRYATACMVLGMGGYLAALRMIPRFAETLLSRGLSGRDLNKADHRIIPEALGLVTAGCFIVCAILCQLLFSHDSSKLLEYNSSLTAVCFMTLLGFADDVLNLRWRYKLLLPLCAALPLVISYRGGTKIVLPHFLVERFLGLRSPLLDIGALYYLYMVLITVFCTNSINIYAGINGLEVGQSVVMAVFIVIDNMVNFFNWRPHTLMEDLDPIVILDATQRIENSFFSLLFTLPFIACSLALLHFNRFPAKVFVGDTYTYFAGVYFAIIGIHGHLSRTLLVFFFPQLLNFAVSLPQLVGLIPCPRHRLPRLDEASGRLKATPNLTLINLTLRVTGPMTEEALCSLLLLLQAVSCIVGVAVHQILFRGL